MIEVKGGMSRAAASFRALAESMRAARPAIEAAGVALRSALGVIEAAGKTSARLRRVWAPTRGDAGALVTMSDGREYRVQASGALKCRALSDRSVRRLQAVSARQFRRARKAARPVRRDRVDERRAWAVDVRLRNRSWRVAGAPIFAGQSWRVDLRRLRIWARALDRWTAGPLGDRAESWAARSGIDG